MADLETIKTEGEAARLAEQKIRPQTEQVAQRLADLKQLYDLQASQVAEDQLTDLQESIEALKAELSH